MAKFEVFIPSVDNTKGIIVLADGKNYVEALKKALVVKGLADCMRHIIIDSWENGLLFVTDTDSGMHFYIREFNPDNKTNITDFVMRKEAAPAASEVGGRDDLLADLFLEISQAREMEQSQGIDFFLDLTLKYLPCEIGFFAKSDLSTTDMEFVACRGPKAQSALGMKVKMGQGLLGFSAKYGCYMAVGDARKDSGFFSDISQKIGCDTNSFFCIPVKSPENNITFGALELINKKESSHFDAYDMEVVRFISENMGKFFHNIWARIDNVF